MENKYRLSSGAFKREEEELIDNIGCNLWKLLEEMKK